MDLEKIYQKLLKGDAVDGWSHASSGDGKVVLRDHKNDEMYEQKTPSGTWVKCKSVGDGFTSNDPS